MKTVSTGSWVTVYMLIQESGVSRLRGHSVLVSAGDEVILFNGIGVHSVPVSTWEGSVYTRSAGFGVSRYSSSGQESRCTSLYSGGGLCTQG